MIPITLADGVQEKALFAKLQARAAETDSKVTEIVQGILANVRQNGDTALREYAECFDHIRMESFAVPQEAIDAAVVSLDSQLRSSMENAARNITDFHKRQLRQSFVDLRPDGTILGQRFKALRRVGLYVPGGTGGSTPLVSSVLMNALPAKVAGVPELVMCTPPGKDGLPAPALLAAAAIAGVDKVYAVGGAQAIAAMVYGTESIPKADKVVGPGNIFVATAKKLLYGLVDIDMIAGPSEILVIADETANPAWLAADLLSQAEHDKLASAVLLCTSRAILEATAAELEAQLAALPRSEIAAEALRNYGAFVLFQNVEAAIRYANLFAPEHLELCVRNPMELLGAIENAGSIFLGHYSPEPVGDYYAGANHVLPTGGTARFFSPLSVDDFVRKTQFISYTREALAAAKEDILTLAAAETLFAHGNAVAIRFS
ncbi:MAG: histidinol dehydrogenase [Oscillospiraceae bacterium]|jgi:histidinol dehydrogenase|nr:histidinol dehydrogenase [Oscillospiraceae bacterium]